MKLFTATLLMFLALAHVAQSSPEESRLLTNLLEGMNTYERPVSSYSEPLSVSMQINIQKLINVDETRETMTSYLWISMHWNAYQLQWDPESFGNITKVQIPANKLWTPDIHLYNSDNPQIDKSSVEAVITNTGEVMMVVPAVVTSSCTIDLIEFPVDQQKCTLKFGSWVYDGKKLNLQIVGNVTQAGLDRYSPNAEWDIISVPAQRNVVLYECCPENPYIDITYSVNILRKPEYYITNIAMPCVLFLFLSVMTFLIPLEAGERITYGITTMLALIIFVLFAGKAIPATSTAVPLISIYMGAVFTINVLALMLSIFVLNIHHTNCKMPRGMKNACFLFAKILCLTIPKEHDDGNEGSQEKVSLMQEKPRSELLELLQEMRYIKDKVKTDRKNNMRIAEWKTAAAAINRLLFILFVILGVVFTLVIVLNIQKKTY